MELGCSWHTLLEGLNRGYDMNTVLVHIGCTGPYITGYEPPAYLERCIEQYQTFNTADLHVLTDKANIPLLRKRPGVFSAPIERYHSDKIARFNALYNYGPREFWSVAITRLIYLENFLRVNKLKHVCHFENDVLVYFNLQEYEPTFTRLYDNLALTPCDLDHHTTGFMYINDYKALEHMTDFFIWALTTFGVNGVVREYSIDMVNDMTLMKRYADNGGTGLVETLPVLPFGEFSQGIDDFGAIFDAAGWGQYICGTQTNGPGITYAGHHVGGFLRAHPESKIVWQVVDGLRMPYLNHDCELVKLNTLHVHSKNMCPYMSRECEP